MDLIKRGIKIRIEEQDELSKALIDYHKVKAPMDFKAELLQYLIGQNKCLVIIDTSLAYKGTDVTGNLSDLYQYLDGQRLSYRSVVIKSDSTTILLGFQVKSDKKTNNHIIAATITSKDIESFLMVNRLSPMFYFNSKLTDWDKLLDRFVEEHGNMEELSEEFEAKLYLDDFMYMINISYRPEYKAYIEEILERHKAGHKANK